ncbi:MAG: hypothetical protein LJE62_04020 [Silicimonas sp.]|nr:hypothetical protein [Silicimonas sp.]
MANKLFEVLKFVSDVVFYDIGVYFLKHVRIAVAKEIKELPNKSLCQLDLFGAPDLDDIHPVPLQNPFRSPRRDLNWQTNTCRTDSASRFAEKRAALPGRSTAQKNTVTHPARDQWG